VRATRLNDVLDAPVRLEEASAVVVGVVEIVRPFGCACAGADLGSGRIVVVVAVLVVVFSEQGIEQGGIGAAHALLHLDEVTLLLLGLLAVAHALDEAVEHG